MALCSNVLLTIFYTAQFNYPLTAKEVWMRLVRTGSSLNAVERELNKLVEIGLLAKFGNNPTYYFPELLKFQKPVEARNQRQKFAQQKQLEISRFLKIVKFLPWVSAVGVTGSMAMNQSLEDGDLDFLIVTKSFSMWLVRPLLVFYAWLMGKRRTWQREEGNSWCFNLWLEEHQLALAVGRLNLYSAYEVCQTKWVFDRAGIAREFYQQNYWASKLLPNLFEVAKRIVQQNAKKSVSNWLASLIVGLFEPLTLVLNYLLYRLQRWYMSGHMTLEEVEVDFAFFHPRDTKSIVENNLKDLLLLFKLKANWSSQPTALVTGVFDIFHQEHLQFLQKARQFADNHKLQLVVGLEQDERVREMKGDSRPVNILAKRISVVVETGLADFVFALPMRFDSLQIRKAFTHALKPKTLLMSSHTKFQVKKKQLMAEVGGTINIVHQHNPLVSSSQLIKPKSA